MTAEALVWKRVSAGEPNAVGFIPGAVEDGVLCLVRPDGQNTSALTYRAFRLGGPQSERLEQLQVAGLEMLPDFARVARVAGDADAPPSGQGVPRLIESALPMGSAVVGKVSGSDTSSLYAVRRGSSPELTAVSTWWEDAATLVILPSRLSVPASCLIGAGGVVPPQTRPKTPEKPTVTTSSTEVPAVKPKSRKALAITGGVAALALVVVGAIYARDWIGKPPIQQPSPDSLREVSAQQEFLRLSDLLTFGDTSQARAGLDSMSRSDSTSVTPQVRALLARLDSVPRRLPPVNRPRIVVTGAVGALEVGDRLQLNATVEHAPSGARPQWSSLDTRIVSVDASGTVHAEGAGTGRVVARVAGVSDTAVITVVAAPVEPPRIARVTVEGRSQMQVGTTAPFRYRAQSSEGAAMNAGSVRWRSSRPDVASVDATGNVTAAGPGTAEIIAVADGIEGRASLRVEQPAPPQDSATDLAELALLTRLSTGAAVMSAEEARDVARRAIALFEELREARNRTEAARVALRASAAAGGSTEACRLLARVTGLTARESEFFRSQNRCP